MSDIGFFVVFYLLPAAVAGAVTWAEARDHGAPPLAGILFSVLPVINLVVAGGWVLLHICRPLDRRLRRGIEPSA